MRRRRNDGAEEIDEHNQPTEPIDTHISPLARTVTDDQAGENTTISTVPASSIQRPQRPAIGAYPYLPPPPTWPNEGPDRPVGSVNAPGNAGTSLSSQGKRPRLFPPLVGLCFVAIQVLLLIDFALKMLGQWNGTAWASMIAMIGDLLTWPLQVLVQQIPLPFTISTQIVILVAILLYGLLSRILVRCLKLLLRPRP